MEELTAKAGAANNARGVRLAEVPTLSVLLTSRGERQRLESCLEVLLPDCQMLGAQVVVVRAADPAEILELSHAYPGAQFAQAPVEASDAELRVLGMAHATGDIVVLRQDDPVPADWLPARVRQGRPESSPEAAGDATPTEVSGAEPE